MKRPRYYTIIYFKNAADQKKREKEKDRAKKFLFISSFNLPKVMLPISKSCTGTEFRTMKIPTNVNFIHLPKKSKLYKFLTNWFMHIWNFKAAVKKAVKYIDMN